jgi:RNA polymerase sigma-70 factor, ECF subfamily
VKRAFCFFDLSAIQNAEINGTVPNARASSRDSNGNHVKRAAPTQTCKAGERSPTAEVALDFETFCRSEYAQVFRAVCLATGDPEVASDATQEAFKRAFVRWRRLSKEPWAGGWVMTTALNLCRMEFRYRARSRNRLALGNSVDTREPTGDRVDVLKALATLPFRQRQAAILYYWGDLSTSVVAELMGLSEGAVRAHLTHARKALRKTLEVIDA